MKRIASPAGLRDFMPAEVRKKRRLQQTIEQIFKQSGCQEISTPTMEYEDTYKTAFQDDMASQEMFSFTGQQGNLTLRVDMTVPIARTASTKLKDERPLRLFYTEDVFKVRRLFQGQRSQVTDCGVEMFGIGEEGDLEILALACQVMDAISEGWMLEIGDVRYFGTACRKLGLDEDTVATLADLIHRKSLPDLQTYLREQDIPEARFFASLPMLAGKEEALQQAADLAFCEEQKQYVLELDDLCAKLEALGYGDHIQVDLGKVPHLNYYTGRIFEAYCPGVGFSVLSGGRYDDLLEKFGQPDPACGFSVKLDYLTDIEPDVKERKCTVIRCGKKRILEGLALAGRIRTQKPAVLEYTDEDILEVLE